MEELSYDPDKFITDPKCFQKLLGIGRENAKTKKKIWEEYVECAKNADCNYKPVNEDNFARLTRALCERARKTGNRIIHCDKGIFIAKNEKEFEKFVKTTMTGIKNETKQISIMKGLSVEHFIRDEFFPKKVNKEPSQLNLLDIDGYEENDSEA